MTTAEARPAAQRKADTLAKLGEAEIDGWVATASLDAEGAPRGHMVPLSLAWIDERIVLAVELTSVTAHAIETTGRARVGIGPTRDVVMIDAVLERLMNTADAPIDLASAYVAQAGWDPGRGDGYVYLILQPRRIQAWREANEIPGRTLMRRGTWLF